jgi:hypothetical protein
MCSTWWIVVLLLLMIIAAGIDKLWEILWCASIRWSQPPWPDHTDYLSIPKPGWTALANLYPSIHAWYPCSWPGGYRLPFPMYRPVFEYFFRLKSGNSQDESTTFPGHILVHRLIAGGLKLQSDCHPMGGNLDRPWGKIHRLIMN